MTLWIAYGSAIFGTALAVAMGWRALWLNGVAYDSSFSTVLRTSRIVSTSAEHNGTYDEGDDDGSQPLPKTLSSAKIVVIVAERRLNAEEATLESKNNVVDEERAGAVTLLSKGQTSGTSAEYSSVVSTPYSSREELEQAIATTGPSRRHSQRDRGARFARESCK